MDVGGKPWNSLPAYVPVTFEVMVLLAGLGVVFAFLFRCRLFPGKKARPHFRSAADNCFLLVLDKAEDAFDADAAKQLCRDFHALRVSEKGAVSDAEERED